MEQFENYVIHKKSASNLLLDYERLLSAIQIELTVLSQFLSLKPVKSNCFYKITIGLTLVSSFEQMTELNNA